MPSQARTYAIARAEGRSGRRGVVIIWYHMVNLGSFFLFRLPLSRFLRNIFRFLQTPFYVYIVLASSAYYYLNLRFPPSLFFVSSVFVFPTDSIVLYFRFPFLVYSPSRFSPSLFTSSPISLFSVSVYVFPHLALRFPRFLCTFSTVSFFIWPFRGKCAASAFA